ncbi:MAG: hypothetical protein ABR591_04095 [Candidatus Velthaea sp.]
MTAQLPALLALVGAALMALAVLAPAKAVSVADPAPAASLPLLEAQREPQWPLLIDPSAAGCGAAARADIVAALAALREPWARVILERAHAEEPDPAVRSALGHALSA